MPRFLLFIVLIGLAAIAGNEAWKVFGPEKQEAPWKRLLTKLSGENSRYSPTISSQRTWTSSDGRTLEAVATALNEDSVQLRVMPHHKVYRVPLQRLSEKDRSFVANWRAKNPDLMPLPPTTPTRWPAQFNAGTSASVVGTTRKSGDYRWQTPSYEFRSTQEVDLQLLSELAPICESIVGATRNAPLPLSWGRLETKRKVVVIHPTLGAYNTFGMPNTAGCFDLTTGEVHVCLPLLFDLDLMGKLQGMELNKRQTYHILVHELIHQATPCIVFSKSPAWVIEGLAEYFSALQYSPGRFRFTDTHTLVQDYLVNRLGYDGVVDLKTYRMFHLENFLHLSMTEWNRRISKEATSGAALIQYFEALLLVDYFSQVDSPSGQYFRAYLEAIITGAPPKEAANRYLLRGRSYTQLEESLHTYWSRRRCNLVFENQPTLDPKDTRLGLGLESSLRQ